MTLEAFLSACDENIENGWFVDNPNGREVNDDLTKLLAVVREMRSALKQIIPRNVPGNQRFGPEQTIAQAALKRCDEICGVSHDHP